MRQAGVPATDLYNDVDVVVAAHVVQAHQARHVLAAIQRAHPFGVDVQLWYLQALPSSVKAALELHVLEGASSSTYNNVLLALETVWPLQAVCLYQDCFANSSWTGKKCK